MRILLTLIALLGFSPLPVHAYLTPEEVLLEDDFVSAPPNARNAEAARNAQEAEYEERSADEENAEPGATEDPDLHGAAPDDELTAEDRRDLRTLERLEQNREEAALDVVLGANETLHGGAPLAPTGMGTIVAMLTIAAAIGLTLRRALRRI